VATTFWRFTNDVGSPAVGPGGLSSGIAVQEGDQVTVTLTNTLSVAVNFTIPGVLSNTPSAAANGGMQTYTFTAPKAGSYFFVDSVNDELAKAMGLSGPLVVAPAGGGNMLYSGGPSFDKQYTLVLHEVDTRVNNAVANGLAPDLANYEPDFYFVNGVSYPASESNPSTAITMTQQQRIAMRFINTGLHINSMHFHGWHVNVATRNRTPETIIVEKDTVPVDVSECVDIILPVGAQVGVYELHNHFLPAVTGNGFYPYGAMLMMTSA
jgi:hypothetical protein